MNKFIITRNTSTMYRYFLIFMVVICFILTKASFSSCSNSPDYSRTPIVFVHGYKSNGDYWDPMIKFLKRSGYAREYLLAIRLYPNTGSNINAAVNQIAPAVEKYLEKINQFLKARYPNVPLKKKIDLLSKSMGALSCRWYAARVRPDRVRLWLSFGGAHHGTNVLCGWPGQGADDLCPAYAKNREESLIQFLLNGKPHVADIDETPYGLGADLPGVKSIPLDDTRSIFYVSIRTSPDKWIKPERSAILDGAGGIKIKFPESTESKETSPGNILMTNGVSHDAMLSDRDTMKLVKIIMGLPDRNRGIQN